MAQQDETTPEALAPHWMEADSGADREKMSWVHMQRIQAESVAHHIDRFRDSRGLSHQCRTESLSEQKARNSCKLSDAYFIA